MSKPFTIDQVSWHTRVEGNPETRQHVIARFWSVVSFLQRNKLTKRTLVTSPAELIDTFAIRSDDLTQGGLELMKAAYEKWLAKVDEGLDPSDVSMLEQYLKANHRWRP